MILGLLTRPQFSFEGEHYRIPQAFCEPKAVQTPHPPVTIGGGGERRTLRSVARFAQRWNTPYTDAPTLRHKLGVLAEPACGKSDRDLAEIDITAQVRYSTPGPTAAACAELADAGLDLAIVTLPPTSTSPRSSSRSRRRCGP